MSTVRVMVVLDVEGLPEDVAHDRIVAWTRTLESFDEMLADFGVGLSGATVSTGPATLAAIQLREDMEAAAIPQSATTAGPPVPAPPPHIRCVRCAGRDGLRSDCEHCAGDGIEPCAACGKAAHVWAYAALRSEGDARRQLCLCTACEEETRGS